MKDSDLRDSSTPPAGPGATGTLDLSNCDREQVQFPGAIMPHGVLLVLAADDLRILGASANAAAWFGNGAADLPGSYLDRILTAADRHRVEDALARLTEPQPPRYLGCFRSLGGTGPFDCFAHRPGAFLVLEFEAIPAAAAQRPTDRLAEVTECIAALRGAATWQDGMDIAVRELKRLTGFDSVIGVRFLPDGSGHAVAEAREPDCASYLDKRFPRSDIPEPGRRQMVLMPLQYAPELDYEPVPLVMADTGAERGPDPLRIDLGLAVLRSMSRMCSRYYLNMGARSRLMLALVDQGELWGFFSCKNATPRTIVYSDRLVCQAFAGMAALLLIEKDKAEQQRDALAARGGISAAAAALYAAESLPGALRDLPGQLLDTLTLTGAALCLDHRITCAGVTPDLDLIKALIPWLDGQGELVVTERLPTLFGPAAACPERATGLLAARLMEPGQYLLGFRPEWVYEVRWAGDPRKPAAYDAGAGEVRLTPRGSFEVWKEVMRGRSRPWRDFEPEALGDLRRAVVLAQNAEKRRALQSLLERSNAELEDFAYVISHDLQEPLRGIRNFAHFLSERSADCLGPQEQAWLTSIMNLTVRMTGQIEALLQYARAGQQALEVRTVDLNTLLAAVIEDLSARIAETSARIDIPATLPCLTCDPIRTAAVFENLITNAIKYNDREHKRVEIGYNSNPVLTLYVRDDGIGIPARDQEAIFTIFRRLHGRDAYGGGTGAGLTIARKHIERQGGRLWLESIPGQGSTFYFTLGPGPVGPIGS